LKELIQIYEAWAAKTKLITACLYFHPAAIFCHLLSWFSKLFSVFVETPGGALKVAKVMTEQLVINALPIFSAYFHYPQQLEKWPGSP